MTVEVSVWDDNFENALKLFKKRVNSDGVLKELKVRSYHLTRTQKRKLKDALSVKRLKQRMARAKQQQEYFVGGHDQQYYAALRKKLAEQQQHAPKGGTPSTEPFEVIEVRQGNDEASQ